MRKPILIFSILFLCCSCKTVKYVTQIQYDTLAVYKNNNIFKHDSIYMYKDKHIYTIGLL